MYPWLWFWLPHIEFPLSGNVKQDIEPVASLFSGSVVPDSGNPNIEKKAFEVASYGKQLGIITDLLIEIAEKSLPAKGQDNKALQDLMRISEKIKKIKDSEYDAEADEILRKVKAITIRGGARSRALSKKLLELQSEDDA